MAKDSGDGVYESQPSGNNSTSSGNNSEIDKPVNRKTVKDISPFDECVCFSKKDNYVVHIKTPTENTFSSEKEKEFIKAKVEYAKAQEDLLKTANKIRENTNKRNNEAIRCKYFSDTLYGKAEMVAMGMIKSVSEFSSIMKLGKAAKIIKELKNADMAADKAANLTQTERTSLLNLENCEKNLNKLDADNLKLDQELTNKMDNLIRAGNFVNRAGKRISSDTSEKTIILP